MGNPGGMLESAALTSIPTGFQMEVVVLAAGQGKRMRSVLPKVLQPIAAKPMLGHVLEAARALEASRICVVYGHGGEAVRERLDARHRLGRQKPQLGTGHAVMQALPHLPTAKWRWCCTATFR